MPNPPPNPPDVTVIIEQPRPRTQVIAGNIQVTGSAESGSGRIISTVVVTVDKVATTLTNDTATPFFWEMWAPCPPGSHTIKAEARIAGHTLATATVGVTAITDVPKLTWSSPSMSGPSAITTSALSFGLQIQATTLAVPVNALQYSLNRGPWIDLGALSPGPGTNVSAQGTISLAGLLNGVLVPRGGGNYPLSIQAITNQGVSSAIALTVTAIDATPPQLIDFTPHEGTKVTADRPLVVTLTVSDQPTPVVTSGIASVSVQLDSLLPVAASSGGGDPSTWSATLPPISHAYHQITVSASDVQGFVTTEQHTVGVMLTSWTRLEPVPVDPTMMEGMQARVADPLWLLARQAAFGEFIGEDTASPVSVRLRARASSLTRMRRSGATGPGERLPTDGGPLEALAEAEAEPGQASGPRDLFAAQAGLHYLRLLARAAGIGDLTAYRTGLLAMYPVPPPPDSTAGDPLLQPYVGRVPNGARLYADLAAALRPAGVLPATPSTGGANPAVVTSVARAWLAWYDAVSGRELGTRDTWMPDRMEYAFSIAAPGPVAETVLAAAQLDTGNLDWFDFDLLSSSKAPSAAAGVSLGAVRADLPPGPPPPPPPPPLPQGETPIVFVGLPTPVTFRGMPNRRWWQFEDASIDFGAVSAAPEDITTSLMVDFAMRYGNDHFIIPVPLEVGSVCRVDSIVVVDTFGEVLLIKPVSSVDKGTGPFRLFEHSVVAGGRDPLFVLFPALGETINGPAIEEVHFVRDEATEMVWAIEHTALGPNGIPVDRTQDALAHFHPMTPTPNDNSAFPVRLYVPRTDVEQNWFPFLLPDSATGTSLLMATVPPLDASQPPLPWGRILAPFTPTSGPPIQAGVALPQEEVTRAGVEVVRAWRYARWIDGRQLCWVGRRVRPGRGQGASGLSFDLAI